MTGILSVGEARERLLATLRPVNSVIVKLGNALGRVTADAVVSPVDLPPFTNSTMDGFALIASDIQSASLTAPILLSVVLDIPAGSFPSKRLHTGQAARIMTGAPLPAGADTVVPIEDTDQVDRTNDASLPASVKLFRPARVHDFVRPAGQDIRVGQLVLPAGHPLHPGDLGILASLGISRVKVYRQPRVALMSSGDELLAVDQPLLPGKIRDANGYMLTAQARLSGVKVVNLGIAPDDEVSVRDRLDQAITNRSDLIVTSAGVSVGAFDFVRKVVSAHGEIDFWRVNIRPGKPLAFGQYRGVPLIGLPGNPASAFVGFEVFVRPALMKISGVSNPQRLAVRVRVAEPIESDGRESYLRSVVYRESDELITRLTGHQGSGNLFSVVQANALLIVPSGVKSLPAGSMLDAWLLGD